MRQLSGLARAPEMMYNNITIIEEVPMPETLRDKIWKDLLGQIQSGLLSTGKLIPSERELQQIYNASRTPIRQALDKLANEGFIVRLPGRGTFVSKVRPGSPKARLSGFSHHYQGDYRDISAVTLSVRRKAPSPRIAEILRISPGTPTTHLERLRLFRGKPVAYMKDTYAPRFPTEPFDANKTFKSVTAFLFENFFVRCTHAKEEVDAILPLRGDQEALKLDPGHPVLQVRRKVYDEKGDPILFSRYVVNSVVWKYRTSLIV